MDTVAQLTGRALYEADEHAWIARQIDALRSGRLNDLDRDTLAEYLTEMTIRDRRELRSRFVVLLQHLLKVGMQRDRLTRSWVLTILTQQQEISALLAGIPSMTTHAEALFEEAYSDAIGRAVVETRIPVGRFPPRSPWTMQEALAFVAPVPPTRSGKRGAGRGEEK